MINLADQDKDVILNQIKRTIMKVKELIEVLSKFDSDLNIVITSMDPTGYTYINDFGGVESMYLSNDGDDSCLMDYEDIENDLDDDENSYKQVLVIDGGDC